MPKQTDTLAEFRPRMANMVFTIVHLPLVDMFIRREEKQLEQKFGGKFVAYRKQVRRWLCLF